MKIEKANPKKKETDTEKQTAELREERTQNIKLYHATRSNQTFKMKIKETNQKKNKEKTLKIIYIKN